MKKTWKKLVVGIFTLALTLTGLNLLSVDGSKVQAAETETSVKYYKQSYTGEKVSSYKSADTAPVPTPAEGQETYNDWLFAGWFTDEACSEALEGEIDTDAIYYAKYVPSEVLSVKVQVTKDTESSSPSADMRLVSTVDSLQYENVGFEVYYNGSTKAVKINTTTVYRRIEAGKGGVDYGFSPNIFDIQSEYFVTATLKNIVNKNFYKGFYIRPYWETLDGTTVYGVSRYARVEDSYLNIVNVPVRVVSDATTATTGTVSVAYDTTYFSYVDTYASTLADGTATSTSGYANGRVFDSVTVDGTTTAGTVAIAGTAEAAQKVNGEVAHLRLQMNEGVTIPKTNVFTVASSDLTENVVVTDSIYKYFDNTTYNGVADTSWYDENETEFVITTPDELYGLASLVNEKKLTTETVYLGSDITVNTETIDPDAEDWTTVSSTLEAWTPIGLFVGNSNSTQAFKGNFDGQGHSISGLYNQYTSNDASEWGAGLFGKISDNAVVKNVKVLNSYFQASNYAGVIGAVQNGIVDTVYTDAIVKVTGSSGGGITGAMYGGTINNCQFAGEVKAGAATFVGGIVGVANGIKSVENCLVTGKMSSTVTGNAYIAGIAGGIQTSMDIKNCLVYAESMDFASTRCSGSVVGRVYNGCTLTVDEVYASNTLCDVRTIGLHPTTTSNGTVSGEADTATDIVGNNAYFSTELDFEEYWAIRETDTPVLKEWVTSGALYAPDTEWAGSGTEEDPWIIKTASELYGLAYKVDTDTEINGYAGKYFKLGANITVNSGTASRWEDEAPKYNWVTIGEKNTPFEGTFDGANYTIKGLYMSSTAVAGLFVDPNAVTIKNLKLTNSYLKGGTGSAAIAGWYAGGTFDTIYSDAIVVSGQHGAGLMSIVNETGTKVNNCWFDGTVTGTKYVGGITSYNSAEIIITNSLNTGTVTTTGDEAGGFIGRASAKVTITDCLNAGTIPTATEAASIIGRIESGTINVERVYALTSANASTYGSKSASATLNGTIDQVADITGAEGYKNTYLTFDRHEEHLPASEQHDGVWVARTGDVPGLKSFVDADDRLELVKQDTYRGDTRWYDENEDATSYTIDTAEELVGLEDLTYEGTSFEGQVIYLGADIAINAGSASDWYAGTGEEKLYNWIPIGNGDSIKFLGTFDGKGHTITGLYAEHSANGIGLFGRIADGSVVRDFKITNSYISGKSGVGSVCGWYAGGTIDTIYSEAIVRGNNSTSSAGHYGGMLGLIGANATIKNCWFAGTIEAIYGYTGGIVGSVLGQANTTIESCLSTGNITGTYDIGGIVGRVTTACTIKDSFSKATLKSTTGSSWVGKIAGRIIGVEVACDRVYVLGSTGNLFQQQNSGTLTGTYAGVDDLTGGDAFLNTWLTFDRPELAEPTTGYWVAVADSTPVLKSFLGDAERVSLDGEYLYRADTRWYDAEATSYVIDTAEELIGFASLVTGGNDFTEKTVTLGADITVNTGKAEDWAAGKNITGLYTWSPIGEYVNDASKSFKGTFDGANYAVKGLYTPGGARAGMFVYPRDCTIKNLKVTNSYFKGNEGTGAVAGWYASGTFDSIYSDAIVKAETTAGVKANHGGGLFALLDGETTTVNNCWFAGQVSGKQFVGGITSITSTAGIKITNCLNTGTVSSSTEEAGGITGRVGANVTIEDCLNTGTITATTKESGGIIGQLYSGTVTANRVYTLSSANSVAVGAGTVSSGIEIVEDLDNYKGYMNTDLDFDNTWVAMEETAPRLQIFAPADGRFDTTSWFTKAAEGTGTTEANPYIIDSLADLYGFTKRVKDGNTFENQYIKLTESITVNTGNPTDDGWATTAPYYVWSPIGGYTNQFKGNFDGGMNTVSGLYATSSYGTSRTTWYVGMFGLANGATIENIRVEDSYFYAVNYSGSVAGALEDGTVSGVYSNSVIAGGDHAGGIVGNMSSSAEQKCYVKSSWFNGEVTGAQFVGGIVDFSSGSGENYIQHCLNTGTVKATTQEAGGVVGRVDAVTFIEDCLGVGTVTSANTDRGSIVGWTEAGSLTMTSVYGYSESGITNGASKVSGGTKAGITATGGTAITDLHAVYDTEAYDKLDSAYWTARVGAVPIPSAFAEAGNYATAAKVGSTYAINTNLTGSGDSESDPILITSAADLYGFALLSQKDSYAGKFIKLADNITVNTATINKDDTEAVYYDWYPIGNATVPFAGTFLGNSKTISGLYKSYDNFDHWIGLFDTTADTSKLSNFRITNTFFLYEGTKADPTRIGSVAGEAYGTIENIYSDATLQSFGRGTGGIIGASASGGTTITITNCWYDGTIISTKDGSSPYMGGIVGIEGNANATISHCLVSGDVLGLDKRVGGLVGSVNNGTLTMTDCLFSGDITGGYTVNTGDYAGYEYVGQLIGAVEASATGTTVTVNSSYGVNDYAPYDIGTKVVYNVTETTENEDGTTTTTVVDTIHPTVNGRGYVSKQYDRLIGYAGTTASLDFTNYWALAKEGTPILKYFADSADIYDGSQIDALLELDYWNSANVALAKAEEKGQGTYMLTISGSNLDAYNAYCAALEAGIFDAYGNDQSGDLNTEGVYNAIYTSANCGDSANDDWVVNVTYVDGTIYISIATGQPLSQHLKADRITAYAAEDGYTTSGLTPTFHMLEEKYYSASSYVIQLSNGHLIVIDGGINTEAPYLFEYMQSLVPEGKKPIIEAWVLSHGHYDHVGAMMGIVQNASTYAGKVYLEGIYYNEASEVVLADYASADDAHHQYMGYIEKISSVFKTTKGGEAEIYRMYTGQRYTFDGVTMDIMLSQELITADDYTSTALGGAGDVFNETSTWTLFTINGKKLLTMGDASEASKERIVDMYSTSYLTVDVFTAMHHGKNINRLSSKILGYPNDSFSQALTVNSVVLYPFTEDLTAESERVGEYVAGRNKAFLNKMNLGIATTYADGSTGTAKYFYYGLGTSVLTFGDTITAEVKEHFDWETIANKWK